MSSGNPVFPPTPKAEWLQQVARDLKGRDIAALAGEWWPGEPIDPLLTAADNPDIVALPDAYFSRPPVLIETLEPGQDETPENFNARILSALENGADTLRIRPAETSPRPVDDWLAGVHQDMISLQVEAGMLPVAAIRSQAAEWPAQCAILIPTFRLEGEEADDLWTLIGELTTAGRPVQPVVDMPIGDDWIRASARQCRHIRRLAEAWPAAAGSVSGIYGQLIFRQPADDFYYRQIIMSRTWQLLLLHLSAGSAPTDTSAHPSRMEVCIRSRTEESPDAFLIRAATSALGACLTGAGGLAVETDATGILPTHYRRAGRNLHHLLMMESQILKGTDPMAGAYVIDYYTRKWATAILEAAAR